VTPDKVSSRSGATISFESAFIGKGHSGGALLNERWELVGMITADEPPDGIAVNIQSVLDALSQWDYPVSLNRRGRLASAPNPVSTEKLKADFSTPKAAIETFFAAAAARDLDMLSLCFANTAPAEFDGLRKKTASKTELDQLAEFVLGATVANVDMSPNETTATVAVRFRSRDERIQLTKTAKGWRIVDF
jgi:hypothetical protein